MSVFYDIVAIAARSPGGDTRAYSHQGCPDSCRLSLGARFLQSGLQPVQGARVCLVRMEGSSVGVLGPDYNQTRAAPHQ